MKINKENTGNQIVLSIQKTVNAAFFQGITEIVAQRIPVLPQGIPFTAQQICGKPFWKSLDEGDKRTAGICISHMAEQQLLPLVDAGKNGSNSKIYQIIK